MDLRSVREEAIEAATRSLFEKNGIVPDEDSEEWEEEYRRQFELAKKRHAAAGETAAVPAAAPSAAAPSTAAALPELDGTAEQARWAATIREDRLREIRDPQIRAWLARTWTRSKSWIDTRGLSPEAFAERARVWHGAHRRQMAEQAKASAAARANEAAAAAALKARLDAAGITADGLLELIDAAERLPAAPLKAKLAEISASGRHLRVFETADPIVLLVKEKNGQGQSEYGIEYDEGLVADLRLYAEALELH
jgi:hypothetical protein